jgi:hypothetical protein
MCGAARQPTDAPRACGVTPSMRLDALRAVTGDLLLHVAVGKRVQLD